MNFTMTYHVYHKERKLKKKIEDLVTYLFDKN